MHNIFIAYDDNGTFKKGTFEECKNNIVAWAEDQEEENGNIYSENELIEIINFFSREHKGKDFISFRGFSIKDITNA